MKVGLKGREARPELKEQQRGASFMCPFLYQEGSMGDLKNGVSRRVFLKKAGGAAAFCAGAAFIPGITLADGSSNVSAGQAISADMDIVITNGLIYDGSLNEPLVADIGIIKDKIVAIGKITGKAEKTIDAAGFIVTPGFIDVHTHCDLTWSRAGYMRALSHVMPSWKGNYNYTSQGVTSVVTGNCGMGYADADYWLKIIEGLDFGSNVYHLAPHGAIREEMLGTEVRPLLSTAQLDNLKARIADEMSKGAVGFSTGLGYAPGVYTSTEEIIAIAKVVRNYGGLYATHIRDESGLIMPSGLPGDVESLKEAIEIGRRAEIPVQISHLKISCPINGLKSETILGLIEKARSEGLTVHADQYPYAAGSTTISILLPPKFLSSSGIKDNYKTKEGQKEVKAAILKVFEFLPPEKTLITLDKKTPSNEGKNLLEISREKGKSPEDVYVGMVCEDESPVGVFFDQDESVVKSLMPRDYVMTASDGFTIPKDMLKPHPRLYGTFPRKIRKYVLDEKVMELKEAIVSMTSLPADKFRMKGRGRIAEGNFADIAVIDLNTIKDCATYTDPHQYSKGIECLLVNGAVSIDKGGFTGERGGKAVRKG
jgi:N-acyl-D-aspartate/D-glutamate deacylase